MVPIRSSLRAVLRVAGPAALAAALLAAGGSASLIERTRRAAARQELEEHEEGRAKRLFAAARASGREPLALPSTVDGLARGIDVLTYDLSLRLDPAVRFLDGTVVVRLLGLAASSPSVSLDLDAAFTPGQVLRGDRPVAGWEHGGGKLVVPLDPPLLKDERTTLTIPYRGVPPDGVLTFWAHPGGLAATSLAEPFGAPGFWPCVDDVSDRAVTTVRVTVPPGYAGVSAGLSTVESGPDGWSTWTWRLPQPIPTYLVSVAVASYVELTDTYRSPDGRAMPIQAFVLPQNVEQNRARVASIRGHLETLVSLFGDYPFLDTKYGIVEFLFSGGMEHPTITGIGTTQLSDPSRDLTTLLVHELAHQWWGDKVAIRSWDDIWLNEGFATYSEVLYREKALGVAPGSVLRNYDDGRYAGALGRQVVAPAGNPFQQSAPIYQKGAWALHMLRRAIGDDAFFRGLRLWSERHAWGNATRQHLRVDLEEVAGRDLKQLFDQWVETPYRVVLRAGYRASADGRQVTVTVSQAQAHAVVHPEPAPGDRPFYVFPLTLRLELAGGQVRDQAILVDAPDVTVTLPADRAVTGLQLDPSSDLLKVVESVGPM